MAKGVQKDVKMLLILALALSLFNVISVQFYLFGLGGNRLSDGFGEMTLPSGEVQKDSVVVTGDSSQKKKGQESSVFQYINDKLKRYGYDTLDTAAPQEEGSPQSNGGDNNSENNPESGTNQSDNLGDDESNAGNDDGLDDGFNQDEDSGDNPDAPGGSTSDSGLPTVPPNDDGPPAQPVYGSVSFGIKSGLG